MKNKPTHTHTFLVSSGYGANTRKPYIEISLDGKLLAQIAPESARALAFNLLSGAEAAEQDAFLFEFFTKNLQAPIEVAGTMLKEFRNWRDTNNPIQP